MAKTSVFASFCNIDVAELHELKFSSTFFRPSLGSERKSAYLCIAIGKKS
jgi:hypothetical protein